MGGRQRRKESLAKDAGRHSEACHIASQQAPPAACVPIFILLCTRRRKKLPVIRHRQTNTSKSHFFSLCQLSSPLANSPAVLPSPPPAYPPLLAKNASLPPFSPPPPFFSPAPLFSPVIPLVGSLFFSCHSEYLISPPLPRPNYPQNLFPREPVQCT